MRSQIFEHFSPLQAQICKGLAILFIVLHNVLAKLSSLPHHNELNFSAERFWDAVSITYANPAEFFRVFMTFFGHYGVQVFIFLSAYGLTRSIGTQPNTWVTFVLKRIKQLLLPMLLVLMFYLILDYYSAGIFSARTGHYDLWDVLFRMMFISNFIPGKTFLVIGPWWFLSMIMQFYCIFLLLHRIQLRWGNASLAIISLLAILVAMEFEPWFNTQNLSLSHTVIGHLPEFALGMYAASVDKIKVPLWLMIAAFIGLFLGNTIHLFWYFAPVCSIIVIMTLCANLFKFISVNHISMRALAYVGLLSMYIFLLNGIIREPFLPLAAAAKNPYIAIAYTLIVIFLCLTTAQLFYWLETYLKTLKESSLKI